MASNSRTHTCSPYGLNIKGFYSFGSKVGLRFLNSSGFPERATFTIHLSNEHFVVLFNNWTHLLTVFVFTSRLKSVSVAALRKVRVGFGLISFFLFKQRRAAVCGARSDLANSGSVVSLSGNENTVTAAVSAPNLSREQTASLPSQN